MDERAGPSYRKAKDDKYDIDQGFDPRTIEHPLAYIFNPVNNTMLTMDFATGKRWEEEVTDTKRFITN